jgi:amidophosphoribosyltransferase
MSSKDKVRDYCGVFGVTSSDYSFSVAGMIYSGLMALQHRGQIFSGISMSDCHGNIITHTGRGLVSKVLNPKHLRGFSGNVGIGHVCYGRPNCESLESAQPYYYKTHNNEFSVALNGTITNREQLVQKLNNMGRFISGNSSIELIATLIDALILLTDDRLGVLKNLFNVVKGAYSLLIIFSDGILYALRDPSGCKPLCYGQFKSDDKKFYIISSESCALDVLGGELIDDIHPGEIVEFRPDSLHIVQEKTKFQKGVCLFEYIYFARPDSIIDGISVAQVRYKLGENLAFDDDMNLSNPIVVPVPDSGRSAAMGYSWKSKLLYQEGLMKNRYMWKLSSQTRNKLNPIKSVITGSDIILIDDSIVSGNTLKEIIYMLRKEGANSIHVRISCPPIIKNCNLNDVFATRKLLIAYDTKEKDYDNFDEEMRKFIDADSLKFQTYDGLINAVGMASNEMCKTCIREFCLIDENIERDAKEIIN